MRKDILAAGFRSAKFAGGVGDGAGPSVMSDEDRAKLEAETAAVVVEKVKKAKKIFRPRGTTLLVQRVSEEELSNVLITDTMEKEKPAEGTVLAIGKKVVDATIRHRVGFGKYAGTEFKLNGETLLIMNEDDIKGTIEDESALSSRFNSWIERAPSFGGSTL